ncbi:glycosyltransferase family 2 protein [Empedobacter falsenii]
MGENLNNTVSASIVLYHNDYDEIKAALNSFYENDYIGKIYLIDNSVNNELEKLKFIAPDKIEYHFLNNNVGFGTAHNVAIKRSIEANYKYHLILNPDVEFEPYVITELTHYLEENEDCGLIIPKVFYKNGDLQYLCKRLPKFYELYGKRILPKSLKDKINARLELHHFNYDKILNVPYLSGCFMLCRNEALDKINGFDERYFMYMEDMDITRSIHKYYKTIFYPNVHIIHGYRSESKVNKKLLIALIKSSIQYYNKYGWFFDSEAKKFNKELMKNFK